MKYFTPLKSFFIAILCITSVNAFAQFNDAIVIETPVGVSPIDAVNTGNYLLNSGGVDYAVSVWDDNGGPNEGFAWQVGANSGNMNIDQASTVVDPDVCIVKNAAGVLFSIVVYFDSGSNIFKMRVFSWNVAQQTFIANVPVDVEPGDYGYSINIDANDNGDFVIVWDQPGNIIQMAIGRAAAGSPPTLTFPSASFNIENGKMPDVSIFRNGGTTASVVKVAYVSVVNEVTVDSYSFNQLLAGNPVFFPIYRSGLADLAWRYPRIATPNAVSGSNTDFTIVVEDSDNTSTWYIKSFTSHTCCPSIQAAILNDGSTGNSPYNLTDVPNTKPVVDYQISGNGVNLGWNFDNSFGLLPLTGAPVAEFPIAVTLNKKGRIYQNANYLTVPINVGFGSSLGQLSMSGRYSNNGMYTFLNHLDGEIYNKLVLDVENAVNLKLIESNNFYEWLNNVSVDENNSDIITVLVYDMLGRQIFNFKGTEGAFKSEWSNFNEKTTTGIFSVHAQTNSKKILPFSGKLFVGN